MKLSRFLPAPHKYLPTVLWALFILLLCAIPGQDLPKVWWLELLSIDKLVHAFLFFVLMLLLSRNLLNGRVELQRGIFISLLCTIAYGVIMEILQGLLFENRSADMYDVLANSTGALVAWWWLYTNKIQ